MSQSLVSSSIQGTGWEAYEWSINIKISNIFTIYYNLQNIIITLKKLDVLFDKIENLNLYCNNKEELKNTLVI